MIGWTVENGQCVRYNFDPKFTEALRQLSKERGGGYIDIKDVDRRAASVVVIPPLPIIIPRLPL